MLHAFRVGDEGSYGAKRLLDDELYAYDVGRRLRELCAGAYYEE